MADSPIEELKALNTVVTQVGDALSAQQDLLRARGMSLPSGLLARISDTGQTLQDIEKNLASEVTELTQLRALAATGAMINTSLDLDAVLANAMDKVVELSGAERGFIILKNEQTDDLEFRITQDNTVKPGSSDNPQISTTILHEAMENSEPLLTDNAYKDPRVQDNMSVAQFVLRSVICVPLKKGTRSIGAVYVDNRLRAGVFTQKELNLLTAFANQVTVAIENARLFTRIRSALDEITEMKDLMDNVFSSIGSGIITTNADNNVMTINRAAEEILGLKAEQAVGHTLLDVLPFINETDVESQLLSTLTSDTDAMIQITVDLAHRSDPVVLSIKLSPLKDDQDHTQGVTLVVDDLTDQTEREAMLSVIENYLPPGLVERIHEIAGIDLGGERREMTCMFIETRPFNSFSSDIEPEDLMATINRYLSVATGAIHNNEGVIDKYMGSEVMVLFNTQLNPQPDHAERAIKTALAIRNAMVEFYAELDIAPDPHFYRIGIHSGIATLGNVGSSHRRNFTAIGDTINLSKRLQENSTAGQIIISENTLQQIGNDPKGFRYEERDPIQVKGRQQYTRIYEVFQDD